jgi:hypothetical protein
VVAVLSGPESVFSELCDSFPNDEVGTGLVLQN